MPQNIKSKDSKPKFSGQAQEKNDHLFITSLEKGTASNDNYKM